jgi:cell division protein FtsQ
LHLRRYSEIDAAILSDLGSMARTNGPTSDGEADFSSRARARSVTGFDDEFVTRDTPDSPRPLDLDPDPESPFLRKQKRVPAKKGALPSRKTAERIKLALLILSIVIVIYAAVTVIERYGQRSWRFRIESSDQIEVAGNHNVSRAQLTDVFGADIARNIFSIPLEDRKKQLEQIPWVESATLMRLLPDRIKVEITERKPVAYVQIGSRVSLIDANGVVMDKPANGQVFPFTVITGMSESEPLSTRAPRMKIFTRMIAEMDAGGNEYSKDFEEVDLSDPDDVKVFVRDENSGVLLHLGSSSFQERYKLYLANVATWRQQVGQLHSVDLRYDRQVIVNRDDAPASQAPPKPEHVVAARPAPARRHSRWHRARR